MEAAGTNPSTAEAIVGKEVGAMRRNMGVNADTVGRIDVDGIHVEYRARMLPDDTVNFGTIFSAKKVMRPLSNSERHAVEKFSIKLRADIRAQIMQDLNAASVHWESGDKSRILFAIDGCIRPLYKSQKTYGIDGRMLDKDGADLTVCLYADENNRILELEVIRWDEKPPIDPQWESLEIFG